MGAKVNGGSECEKWCKMAIKQRKEQKQVVIKHKPNVYTEVRYLAIKLSVNSTKMERK